MIRLHACFLDKDCSYNFISRKPERLWRLHITWGKLGDGHGIGIALAPSGKFVGKLDDPKTYWTDRGR